MCIYDQTYLPELSKFSTEKISPTYLLDNKLDLNDTYYDC